MLKWMAQPRFNWIIVLTIAATISRISVGDYATAGVVYLAGLALSIWAERKTGEE